MKFKLLRNVRWLSADSPTTTYIQTFDDNSVLKEQNVTATRRLILESGDDVSLAVDKTINLNGT